MVESINNISPNIIEKIKDATKDTGVSTDSFETLFEEAKKSGDTEALKKATTELESIFVNMMMKTMRNSIPESEGIFKKSEAEKMFSEMLDEEFAKKMSEAGGIGIGDMIFDQFEKYLYNEEDEKQSSFELKG